MPDHPACTGLIPFRNSVIFWWSDERVEPDLYGADPNAAFAIQTIESVVSTSSISSPDLIQRIFGGLHDMLPELLRPNLFAGFIAFGKEISQKAMMSKLQAEDIGALFFGYDSLRPLFRFPRNDPVSLQYSYSRHTIQMHIIYLRGL